MKTLLAAVALAFAVPAAHAQFDIGRAIDVAKKLGDSAKTASKEFSQDDEVHLGEGIAAGVLGAAKLHSDERLQRYVNRVGRWIASQSERADLPWSFGVLDSDTVNAFAMPGGTIMVTSGLLKKLNSESELAGVLAHEIGHVVKKHQLQAIQSGASSDMLATLGKEAASYKLGRSGKDVMGLGSAAAGMGVDLVKNGFLVKPLDRGMEYEADRVGVVLAARAGYDPFGLVSALQMLQSLRAEESGASLLFATHPTPSDRISELEKVLPSLERYASQPQVEGRFRQTMGAAK
ncbi:M48 family metalloprotease [Usitatibacter palustris]|uniref:Beta-barrel assembly-enhancing protease n=1 Tax=Usitatibacter palustris TaxID=2732487 RepID=A0A6M4HBS1_9PROT|nr:M48 family metalloprotease [Usitatibacter palustris]QJR16268.1 Beta-barrel assembly-enhancing protease [Usitatibacter palustris]